MKGSYRSLELKICKLLLVLYIYSRSVSQISEYPDIQICYLDPWIESFWIWDLVLSTVNPWSWGSLDGPVSQAVCGPYCTEDICIFP